jgi:hypothetical protein
MTLGEALIMAAWGGAIGYQVHKKGIDKKVLASAENFLDGWTARSARIMLDEVEKRAPIAST